jgi:hypothetical protein
MEEIVTYKNKELIKEDFSLAKLPKIRNEFIAKLENALMMLSYKDLSMWHNEVKNKVDLRQFDGAWLTDVSLKHEDNDSFAFAPYGDLQVTPNMFPNLNIKTLNLSGEIGYMSKIKFLDMTEKRHLENYRYIYSHKVGFLDYGKQKWWTDENGFGFNKIHEFNKDDKAITKAIIPFPTSLKSGFYFDKESIKNYMGALTENGAYTPFGLEIRDLHMALQLALTYDYEWSCYIKESKDSLGVRIPIHPSSSKDVFMMRNLPEGKTRKRAIVNFVKEHYRTITGCNNNERDVLIQKHLRGDLKFNWRGLEVHITPSPYDLRTVKTKKILNGQTN